MRVTLEFCGIALLCFSCCSCGSGQKAALFSVERAIVPVHIPDDYVALELAPFLDDFRRDAALHARDLEEPDRFRLDWFGSLEDPDDGQVGFCQRRVVERRLSQTVVDIRTIEISRSLSDQPHSLRRSIYHELGHCLLGLDHDDVVSPESIMAAKFVSRAYTPKEWSRLVAELLATQP